MGPNSHSLISNHLDVTKGGGISSRESTSNDYDPYGADGIDYFYRVANPQNVAHSRNRSSPVTDKVTTHTYQIMYGKFLLPHYKKNPNMTMLEIGLGCDMNYGPGASVAVWKELFPSADLWEAEYNGRCVRKSRADGKLDGISVLVGDQGDPAVLDRWVRESPPAGYDVIIDDGGHRNCQIYASLQKLWPILKPNGLYFIEDMQVARNKAYKSVAVEEVGCTRDDIVPDKTIKQVVDDLMYGHRETDIEFLFCQGEACVIGKKPEHPWA